MREKNNSLFTCTFAFLTTLTIAFVLAPTMGGFTIRVNTISGPSTQGIRRKLIPHLNKLTVCTKFVMSIVLAINFACRVAKVVVNTAYLIFIKVTSSVISLPTGIGLLKRVLSTTILIVFFSIGVS